MTAYFNSNFLCNSYSNEISPVNEIEHDEVMRLIAAEGYIDWLDELERQRDEHAAWRGAKEFNGILIKKACEHSSCSHFRCERGLRIGGIEI